jgi:hypothetical protein
MRTDCPNREDRYDEWQAGDRSYLSEASMTLFKSNGDTRAIAAIDSGE